MREGVAGVPRDAWNALVGDASPFLEWEWLASLEEAGCVGAETGWLPRPLVARRGERLVAACPLYVKAHSEGEFVFDWSWADAAERAGIDYYPKLLVGVPFTPVSGARILVAPGEERGAWVRRFGAALRELCGANEISGAHVNFCRPDEVPALEECGFLPRLGFQYHWRNEGYASFGDYLANLRSKRRNQVRRERRGVAEAGVRVEAVPGEEASQAVFDAMFRCYRATVDARHWGRRYLNRRFFELLQERFRHRLCFVVARDGSEVLAGTSNVVKGDAFYGRYWGALRPLRHLHFDVCYYTAIEHCIERGLRRFEPGAGGDYKWIRGFDPQPTWSAHWLAEPRLADAVARFLEEERSHAREVMDVLQERSALKQASAEPPA